MMKALKLIRVCAAVAIAVVSLGAFQAAQAGTILKLSLGNDVQPDLEYISSTLSTVDDLDGTSPGDQNTAVEFLDFLTGVHTNIAAADGSYSLNGVTASGPPTVLFGAIVVQQLTGGNFQLWDENDILLLDATLGDSVLNGTTGFAGPSQTGGVFTTTFGTILGGTLAQYIAPNTISVSIAMTGVASGATAGMIVNAGPQGDVLADFTADATETIAAEPVPEPATVALILLGTIAPLTIARRR
jgi:hypothetical protein